MSTKTPQTCAHCGKAAFPNRMTIFRTSWRDVQTGRVRPGNHSAMVHKECVSGYEVRRKQMAYLEDFVLTNRRRGWFMRLALAPTLYSLKRRLVSHREALRSVRYWLFRGRNRA